MENTEQILATETVGDFLRLWVKTTNPKLSLADLSNRCGLKSKGFLHDLLSNRRVMTLETMNRVSQGLEITAHWRRHLRILCELQDAEPQRQKKLRETLSRNRIRALKVLSTLKHPDIPALKDWDRVYAASGTVEEGATLEEICSRSRLPEERVRSLVEIMTAQGLLRQADEGRILPIALYGHFTVSQGKTNIPNYLVETVDEIRQGCQKVVETGQSTQLYRSLVFSTDSERFPEFRDRLRTLIREFSNGAEEPRGDRLARIFVAFELLE